jgi:hypothetical protein
VGIGSTLSREAEATTVIETTPYSGTNRLLQSISQADFALLSPELSSVSLAPLKPLETADEVPRLIYFPEGSVASVVAKFRSKKDFEVGLIGWEGMTGTSVLDGAPSPFDCYVQFEGRAKVMGTKALVAAVNASQTLRAGLSLYAHSLSVQTAYTALASAHAPIPERLARWLVMIEDRIEGQAFEVTHELLCIMLGVRRSGVTVALHELEGEGLIKSTRGHVEILDRSGLIARAGNAYGKAERSYDELLEAVDPELVKLEMHTKTHDGGTG